MVDTAETSVVGEDFRRALTNTLERRFFYIPSFRIYGAFAGLYDYGQPGCKLKKNVLALWNQHFVHEENMWEVDCPCITPEAVLKASGHVDRFTDLMVKDLRKGTCYRADHLLKQFCNKMLEEGSRISSEMEMELKEVLSKLDGFSAQELGAYIRKYGITAPDTDENLGSVSFQLDVSNVNWFRLVRALETAQGIFVNFRDIYYDNGNKLPFAVAQVGQALRNEISPRQGLLRVREFTLAEIEHFVDPEDKSHLKFPNVERLELLMFPRDEQNPGHSARIISLGEAVCSKIVDNETLGYFIGRVYLFLTRLGIDKNRLRFRQHLAKKMAHYAADCWDAEIETSYGWIECVGIADRSAYDLKAHSEKSGIPLKAHKQLSEPREVEKLVITPVMKEIGPALRNKLKNVLEALEAINEEEISKMKTGLDSKGEVDLYVCTLEEHVSIKSNMVTISRVKTREHQRKLTPSMIEPSFGIGRVIYCLFEHSYYTRPDKDGVDQLSVFRFNLLVVPLSARFSLWFRTSNSSMLPRTFPSHCLLLAYYIKWTQQVPRLGNVMHVMMSLVYPLQSRLILHRR